MEENIMNKSADTQAEPAKETSVVTGKKSSAGVAIFIGKHSKFDLPEDRVMNGLVTISHMEIMSDITSHYHIETDYLPAATLVNNELIAACKVTLTHESGESVITVGELSSKEYDAYSHYCSKTGQYPAILEYVESRAVDAAYLKINMFQGTYLETSVNLEAETGIDAKYRLYQIWNTNFPVLSSPAQSNSGSYKECGGEIASSYIPEPDAYSDEAIYDDEYFVSDQFSFASSLPVADGNDGFDKLIQMPQAEVSSPLSIEVSGKTRTFRLDTVLHDKFTKKVKVCLFSGEELGHVFYNQKTYRWESGSFDISEFEQNELYRIVSEHIGTTLYSWKGYEVK